MWQAKVNTAFQKKSVKKIVWGSERCKCDNMQKRKLKKKEEIWKGQILFHSIVEIASGCSIKHTTKAEYTKITIMTMTRAKLLQ